MTRRNDGPSVTIGRKRIKKPSGRVYEYVELRWVDPRTGKRLSRTLGRVGEVSDRKAKRLAQNKAGELLMQGEPEIEKLDPLTLKTHMARYIIARRQELAPGTMGLHRQSLRYLRKFFRLRGTPDPVLREITRSHARDFATELGAGKLSRQRMVAATVSIHVRNARTLFGMAVEDELLAKNPFDRLAIAGAAAAESEWHYVDDAETQRLMDACFGSAWELLFGLCRWAGLRRGEALALKWQHVDFEVKRLTVIASDEWRPKDRDSRKVPMPARLVNLLTQALVRCQEGEQFVIPPGSIVRQNISRDFGVIHRRAKVPAYRKPLHSMRKSCLTDWAGRFAMHEVKEWAGHASIATTQKYYLKVSERSYRDAAAMDLPSDVVPRTDATSDATRPKKDRSAERGQR